MFEVIGKHNKAVVYAESVDPESYAQVLAMCNKEELKNCTIRMMPDMHASEGCTVGTSMTFDDRINPAYVGGDIGCGMQVYQLQQTQLDLAALDHAIRETIPSGAAIFAHSNPAVHKLPLQELTCYEAVDRKTVNCSFGTLGGGNHFIEVDRDTQGNLYLVIHSGSRRLGRDVALYHQAQAFFQAHGIEEEEVRRKRLRPRDIKSVLRPQDCFLSADRLTRYLNDMNIAMTYAAESRKNMGKALLSALHLDAVDEFTTVHNYIDVPGKVLRKGAVSAKEGERLIIPINMRDGSLICAGKGNPQWNQTAPHGAGRVLKRSEAREQISLDAYKSAMEGIYSTSISEHTLDESPMAYRGMDEIASAIEPTVTIREIITPVYNFKASKAVVDETTKDGED